ncbi:beta-lactamase family protein [Rhodocytophaga rosea]|uniref:Beta-lactamase family protein n=1 Tax=Rhodocytophaga rosea TaxID=2704465 RepID=A0A6C0GEJ6_9BACT|nr:serine hydrolase domain-containing protein [Rhodocytophaga rosea]QHT66411.1 beta-lactamase family protein [Rhodocytophaga rosea]
MFFCCTSNKKELGIDSDLGQKVDKLVQPYINESKVAGMVVGVFKDHQPLVLKAYGFADLELDVKLPVNASFEIGSVTKQFTAAAILQLAEQQKLSLEDDITKYIAFDTHGKKVTLRQLLSHTSGIKGYTELPVFGQLSVHTYSRDTLLRLVEKEPFDFDPGEALIYNNTAFFMLGLIIEKVSGMAYEAYVKTHLFDKAGMTNSYYCSESKITKNRAHGYDTNKEGLVRAAYLDHTWPYAAGSLCSTVEDLEKWNNALHHGKILSEKMYAEFITPVQLNDGTPTHYAKGITVTDWKGKRLLEHGGGINGFLSQNSYFPEEDVSIIVLINTTSVGPREIADQIAGFLFKDSSGKVNTFSGDISKYTGHYKGRGRGQDLAVQVSKNNSDLMIDMGEGNGNKKTLHFIKENTWSDGFATYLFEETDGKVKALRIDQVYGYYIIPRLV